MGCHHFLRSAAAGVLAFCPALLWASQPLPHPQVTQIPAVAVSNAPVGRDAPNLAWIVSNAGATTLILATMTGKNARPVAISGGCTATGLRWANGYPIPASGGRNQHELAIMTHCGSGREAMHSVIWLLNVQHENDPPRKVIDLAGYAHCMQWTAQNSGIAFLYVPGATRAPDASTSGNCLSHGINSLSTPANDVQRVGMLSLANKKVEMVTPAGMDVYEFAWTANGQQALLYVATQPGEARWDGKLYRKWGDPSASQWVVVDPLKSPQLRGRHISMPSWGIYHPTVSFLGIKNVQGVTAGEWYRSSATGQGLVNLTADTNLKPSWVGYGYGTRRAGRNVEVLVLPSSFYNRPTVHTQVRYSVRGTISDGRAPLALSVGLHGIAFVERLPDSAPKVHAQPYFGYGVPPPIAPIVHGMGAASTHNEP